MKLMNVKGTFDFMPEDMQIRNKIMDTLRRNFEKYGYLPIETPMLNYFDLLSYKYSDDAEILSEIYRLTDQGDNPVYQKDVSAKIQSINPILALCAGTNNQQ